MRRLTIAALAGAIALSQVLLARPDTVAAQTVPAPTVGTPPITAPPTLDSFVRDLVIPHVDDFWRQAFRANGRIYTSPNLQLLRPGQTTTCGGERSGGHGYCFLDRTLALDLGSAHELSFGTIWRRGEDYAIVAIIAHEFAHHVQNLLGITPMTGPTQVRELQADCMAGLYTRYAELKGYLDPGDLDEGIAISLRSGDPSHGSGAQRAEAFRRGYNGYSGAACGIR
jgi:hypothetical protein